MFKLQKKSIIALYSVSTLLLVQATAAQADWSAYSIEPAPGLTGAGFETASGYRYSKVSDNNSVGDLVGYSRRLNAAGVDLGSAAWLRSGGTIAELGLTGADYQKANGYRSSGVYGVNNAGQVLGASMRYNSLGYENGQALWLHEAGVTTELGLTGVLYRGTNGERNGYARFGAGGHIIGTSCAYRNAYCYGQAAWIYANGTATEIGLQGTPYGGIGYRDDMVNVANSSGQVVGSSTYHKQSNNRWGYNGSSAWLYSGGTTVEIGLTRTTGAEARVRDLNEAGQAVGDTAGLAAGRLSWIFRNGVSQEIGLTAAEFTNPVNGARSNSVSDLNNLGRAVGSTARYNPESQYFDRGAAWYFDGTSTVEIGLAGGVYQTADGQRSAGASRINDAGQILGSSARFDQGTGGDRGSSAWLFDTATNQYFDFTLSISNMGFAYSSATYLGEDGLVLGNYMYYKDGIQQGYRAFAFTMLDGLTDLGLLIDGDLSANGWSSLAFSYRKSGSAIWGTGNKDGKDQGFLLTAVPGKTATKAGLLPDAFYQGPYVPEPPSGVPIPGAFWLMGSGLAGLVALNRRKTS
jgi:hypothetical protein